MQLYAALWQQFPLILVIKLLLSTGIVVVEATKKVQAMRPSWALYAMNANFFSLTTSLLLQISLFFVVFFSLLARRFFYVTLIDIVKIATWTWSWTVSAKWTQRDEMGVRRKGRSLMALFKNLIIKMVEWKDKFTSFLHSAGEKWTMEILLISDVLP